MYSTFSCSVCLLIIHHWHSPYAHSEWVSDTAADLTRNGPLCASPHSFMTVCGSAPKSQPAATPAVPMYTHRVRADRACPTPIPQSFTANESSELSATSAAFLIQFKSTERSSKCRETERRRQETSSSSSTWRCCATHGSCMRATAEQGPSVSRRIGIFTFDLFRRTVLKNAQKFIKGSPNFGLV